MNASQNMIAAPSKNTCLPDSSPKCEDPPPLSSSSNTNVLKDFLSYVLAQPDAMNDPAFFKFNISCTKTVQEIATRSSTSKQSADAEDGQKKQKSVSVTHDTVFDEQINITQPFKPSKFLSNPI
jgi:hypothetical protein